MKPYQTLFTILFILSFFTTYSQVDTIQNSKTNSLRIYTKPKEGVIIKIDSNYFSFGKQYFFKPGKYTFLVWAPTRELISHEINITKQSFVKIKLPYTKEYKTYRKKLLAYKVKKQSLRYLLLGGFAYYTSQAMSNIHSLNKELDREKEAALQAQDQYNAAIWLEDFNTYRTKFEAHKSNYNNTLDEINKSWTNLTIAASLTAVSTYFTWRMSNKIIKPQYKETPLLSSSSIGPSFINNHLVMNLTLNIH